LQFGGQNIFLSIVEKLHSINSISLKSLKVNIRKGIFDLSPNNYQKNGIPFLRVSDIKEGTINFDNTVFISNEKHQEESYTKFISTDPIYQQLYKDARISNISAPRTSVIKYNPQTRSLGQ
jgi:hypothetical protein